MGYRAAPCGKKDVRLYIRHLMQTYRQRFFSIGSNKMIRIIRYLFSAAIFGFLIYYIYQHKEAISINEVIQHKRAVGACLVMLMAAYLAGGFGWILIMREMKVEANIKESLRAWFVSQLGKYVPGKIWGAVSRLYLVSGDGSRVQVGYSILLEMVLVNITGLCVFLFSLILWEPMITGLGRKYLWAAVTIPVLLVLLHPDLMEKAVNLVLRRMNKDPIKLQLKIGAIMSLFLYYIFFWCLYGLSFGILASAFMEVTIKNVLIFSGMYIFAFLVGFLSLISPSGLGVREGVLSVLLSNCMPAHTAVYVSVLSRILFTVVELGMVLIFLFYVKPGSIKQVTSWG